MKSLFEVCNSKTKAKIIQFLYSNKDKEFYGKELANQLNIGESLICVVIPTLVNEDYVIIKKLGNMRFYSLNKMKIREILQSMLSRLEER